MQVLFAHLLWPSLAKLVYGNCSKIKMIILISYLRARWFQIGLKWTGFLEKSHLFAFNNLRIVYSMEKMPIILYCITNWFLMTLHSELLPYQTLSYSLYWCTDIFSKSHQPSMEAMSCVQNRKNHFKIWLRKTVTNVRLSFVYKRTRKRLKPIDHVLLKFA